MKFDMNVRTHPVSKDSLMPLESCFRRARECGLDAVVLMEKNIVRDDGTLTWAQELAQAYGISVHQGLYLHTTLGPILLYGMARDDVRTSGLRIANPPDTLAALEWAEERGWAAVLSAPFRYGVGPDMGLCARFKSSDDPVSDARRELGYVIRKFRAVEVNGCAGKSDNDLAVALARCFNIPYIVGSGAAHAAQMRKGAWTDMPGRTTTSPLIADAIIRQSRKGGAFRVPDLKSIYTTGG